MSDSVRSHRRQPTRLPHPWDSPGKNTGVGRHFLLQCMKVKSESEVTQSCLTLSDPVDCSLPGSSVHGIFQARALEWGAIAFSKRTVCSLLKASRYPSMWYMHLPVPGHHRLHTDQNCAVHTSEPRCNGPRAPALHQHVAAHTPPPAI